MVKSRGRQRLIGFRGDGVGWSGRAHQASIKVMAGNHPLHSVRL